MNMIELKYNRVGNGKKYIFNLGGFELQAPHKYDFKLAGSVRRGELSTQFKLKIPKDGVCSIPDTQYNRDKLKAKFEMEGDKKRYIFEILSDIDLNEDAAHAGGGSISLSEQRDLKREISELKAKNQEMVEANKQKKVEVKTKKGGRTKKAEAQRFLMEMLL